MDHLVLSFLYPQGGHTTIEDLFILNIYPQWIYPFQKLFFTVENEGINGDTQVYLEKSAQISIDYNLVSISLQMWISYPQFEPDNLDLLYLRSLLVS